MKLRDKTLVDIIKDTLKKEKIESREAIVAFIRCYYRCFSRHIRGIYKTTQTEIIPGEHGTVVGISEERSVTLYYYPPVQYICAFAIGVTKDKIRIKRYSYNEASNDKGYIQTIDRGYKRNFSGTECNKRKGSNN